MQLEAGKCYVDRKGRVFGPLVRSKGNTFGEGSYSSWYPDGRQSFQCEMPTDLIAEHVPFVSCSHFVTPVDDIVFTVGYGAGGGASDPDEDFVGDLIAEYVPETVPEWRMLRAYEVIERGDEVNYVGGRWTRASVSIGQVVRVEDVGTVRRRIVPQASSAPHMIETEHIAHVLRPGVDSVWNGNAWIPYTGKKTSLGMTKYPRARFLKSAAPVASPRDINYIPRYADGWKPEAELSHVAIGMLNIMFHANSTPEERVMAASTLVEAVYPEILARKQ